MNNVLGERAVVLGAGIAGLLAARVLADRYADVTVIDRDELPEGVEPRRGVPQARHAHALLARGQQLLEQLFPGFTDELAADGALIGDVLGETRMYLSGHRLRSASSGLVAVSASRALMEGHLRARVRELPNVHLLGRCDALGLTSTSDGRTVTGVRLLRRADHSAEEVLQAEVVIDTTGRTSRAPAWLRALGLDGPDEERLPIDVTYATRRYCLGADALGGDLAVLHGLTPDHPRGGVLALVGRGEAMLTLAGILGDRPPTDAEGFAAFAASLRFPDIQDTVRDAEPLDDPVPYRFPASVWLHYERLRQIPDGFAVMGDGMCSFNPIYGQGISIAALEAVALRRHLERHGRIRSRRFHRQLARLLRSPWQMATGADLSFPGLEEGPGRLQRVLGAYINRVHAAAAHDETVACSFVYVAGLVDPPQKLLRPLVVSRVLRASRRASTRQNGPHPGTSR
jgi:2-polyprenyl-6-methoxyphenol hydroxylase-like FAD-dependent oxidoreductase